MAAVTPLTSGARPHLLPAVLRFQMAVVQKHADVFVPLPFKY